MMSKQAKGIAAALERGYRRATQVQLEPLGRMLVIRAEAPHALKSDVIAVVDFSPKPAVRGEVLAIGPEVRDITVGQRVIFSKLQGYEVDLGQPLVLLQEGAVLATE